MDHSYLQHAEDGWDGVQALRYCTYMILEGSDLKDIVAFTHGASIGTERGLSWTDEGKECGDVRNESKKDGTNCSRGSASENSALTSLMW